LFPEDTELYISRIAILVYFLSGFERPFRFLWYIFEHLPFCLPTSGCTTVLAQECPIFLCEGDSGEPNWIYLHFWVIVFQHELSFWELVVVSWRHMIQLRSSFQCWQEFSCPFHKIHYNELQYQVWSQPICFHLCSSLHHFD